MSPAVTVPNMSGITFALQAGLTEPEAWSALARKAESAGFDSFVVADHPGIGASPFVALATAAAATKRISLGTYVLNAGVRDPLHIAADVATLDVLSRGRAQLGIGAGHTPSEWRMTGRTYPSARRRVTRLRESTDVIRQLLDGHTVTFQGDEINANEAFLAAPRPRQRHIPLLIGGNSHTLLRDAAARADLVSIAGLGRTLADGHQHEVRWRDADVDETIATIMEGARSRAQPPLIDALVQHIEITHDTLAAAARLAARVPGLEPADALSCPFVLIGAEADVVNELRRHHERWGISRFTVRADAFDAAARFIKWLRR
jgi:probable F420-dependent oxidoreductase